MKDNVPINPDENGGIVAGDRFFDGIDVEFLIHELKDPISVIETALRLLIERQEKYGPLTARQEKTLNRALRSSRKARSLLADLLEVGRSDAGCYQYRRFKALAAVEQALAEALETADPGSWETLAQAGGAALSSAALGRLGIAVGCADNDRCLELALDENKFRQIVGNLIKNALQHRRQRLDIRLSRQDERLCLEVADDGPGVATAHSELIFNCYTRINTNAMPSRSGHGLGLAGARILARRMGGDITVTAGWDGGAKFHLTLPLTAATMACG